MLLTKQSLKASPLLDYAKTTRRGNSGTPSAHGCASQPISEAYKTRSSSYKYFLTRSARASLRPTTSPSQKKSLEQYIRSVGQIFTAMGAPDPRLNNMGATDFCLGRQFATYEKKYSASGRVFPLPVSILHYIDSVTNRGSPRNKAIAYLAWIALLFLRQPREYCTGGTDTFFTLFNLRGIQFFVVNQPTHATTASATTCAAATFASFLFKTQKMVSKENRSETAPQDTPAHVQWHPYVAVWHTYDNTAPSQTRISPQFSTELSGP